MLSLSSLLLILATTPTPATSADQRASLAILLEPSAPTFPRSTSVDFRVSVLNIDRNGQSVYVDPFVLGMGTCWRPINSALTIDVRDSADNVISPPEPSLVADCAFPSVGDLVKLPPNRFIGSTLWLGGRWSFRPGRYSVTVRLALHLQTVARENPSFLQALARANRVTDTELLPKLAEGSWESSKVFFQVGAQ